MASVYRWVDHTGELELELKAEDEPGVFAQGFEAMRELLGGESEPAAPRRSREIALEAPDRAALLADWLGELAYLAESEGLIPERLVSLGLEGGSLSGVIEASLGEPPHLVKAATYHRLALEPTPDGSGWQASVVLDV